MKLHSTLLVLGTLMMGCQAAPPSDGAGSTSSGSTQKVYLLASGFSTSINGQMFGRAGSDSACSALKSSNFPSVPCTTNHMLISVNAGDSIANFTANYGTPAGAQVVRSDGTTEVAASWAAFASGTGTLTNSIDSGSYMYWTGASSVGALGTNHCTNWGVNTGNGTVGNTGTTSTGVWLNTGGTVACGTGAPYVCACW